MEDLKQKSGWPWAEAALVLMLASRPVASVFVAFFGLKGILYAMILTVFLLACGTIAALSRRENRRVLWFFDVLFLLIAAACWVMVGKFDLTYWLLGSPWSLFHAVLDPRSGLWLLLALLALGDQERAWRAMTCAAWLMLLFCLFQTGAFWTYGDWRLYYHTYVSKLTYNMTYGYDLGFAVTVLVLRAWNRGAVLAASLLGFVAGWAVLYGSRGALLLFLVLVGLSVLFNPAKGQDRSRWFSLAAFILALGLSLWLTPIVQESARPVLQHAFLNETLKVDNSGDEGAAVESRTLKALQDGNLSASNGRGAIMELSLEGIKKHPLSGGGLFADRLYVGREYEWGYSHNIFLEVYAHWGLFGAVFLLAMAGFLVFRLWVTQGEKRLILMALVVCCSKLLVSDSYLFLNYFWALLGLLALDLPAGGRRLNGALCLVTFLFAFLSVGRFAFWAKENCEFKAHRFDRPTVLFILAPEGNPLPVIDRLTRQGFTGTLFINPEFDAGREGTFAPLALQAGWDVQDGGADRQRISSVLWDDFFARRRAWEGRFQQVAGLKPSAYLLPNGSLTAAEVYRSLGERKFLQERAHTVASGLSTMLTAPRALAMRALNLRWYTPSGMVAVKARIDLAYERRGLLLVYVNPLTVNLRQLDFVARYLRKAGFVSTNYRELDEMTRLEKGTSSWKNAFLNSYIYDRLKQVF